MSARAPSLNVIMIKPQMYFTCTVAQCHLKEKMFQLSLDPEDTWESVVMANQAFVRVSLAGNVTDCSGEV